jgi:hypothetical protein
MQNGVIMHNSASINSSTREIGDIRRGDEVDLNPAVQASPPCQLAWQQLRERIGVASIS